MNTPTINQPTINQSIINQPIINQPIVETAPIQTEELEKTSAVKFSNDTIDYNLKIDPTIIHEDLNLIDLDELDNEMKLDIVDLDSSFPELHE
jgi:hypothetical protein